MENRFDVRIAFTDKDGVKGIAQSGQIALSMAEAKRKAILESDIPEGSKIDSVVSIPTMHKDAP